MIRIAALIAVMWATPILAGAFPVQRCVNLSNALEAPREGDWGYQIRDVDLGAIAQAGFDAVRLPVRVSAYLEAGRIHASLLDRLDHVVRASLSRELKVILDVHHFDALMRDPAQHGPTLVAIWDQLGSHFKGWPDGLLFELLNEPEGRLTTARADALYDQIIPRLRRDHPDRWLIVGGGNWNAFGALTDMASRDARTAFTFHYYDPFGFTHQGAPWTGNPPPPRGEMTDAEAAQITQDFASLSAPGPIFLGEFGVIDTVPLDQRAAWTAHVRRAAEDAKVGWCHWGFAMGFDVYDPDRQQWIPQMRDALMR